MSRTKRINTGDTATNALYDAVTEYIASRGGKAVVIGGVQVQEWPGDRAMSFTLGIKITGRKPTFAVQP